MQQIIAPEFRAATSPLSEGEGQWQLHGRVPRASLCSFFALEFGGLLDGPVLVQQLQHLLLVVEHLHHGVSGLRYLVHHQLTALHVALRTQ